MEEKETVDIELPAPMIEELSKYGDPTEEITKAVKKELNIYRICGKERPRKLIIDDTITIPIHHEILETMKDELDDHKDDNLEVVQFCQTIGGQKLIRYLFVPCDEHGE
jgi:hypothetical protein